MFKNRVIITGGLGFIGTNLILNLIKSKYKILNLDKNSDSSNKKLINYYHNNYLYKKIDLSKSGNEHQILKIIEKFKPQIIINLAAESHVDKSIDNPKKIYSSNVNCTLNLLLAINRSILKKKIKLIHFGTDEIYGDLSLHSKKKFTENSRYFTSNPYSASKAAQINLIQSFIRTYNINAIIVNPCNNYGFYQYPEKLIPRSIRLILSNKPVELYGNGKNRREWTFIDDTVEAIKIIIKKGKIGHIYNLSTEKWGGNISNSLLIKKIFKILRQLNKNYFLKINYVKDRPGHDLQYSTSGKKIIALGWKPKYSLEKGIKKTLLWYLNEENVALFKKKLFLKRFGLINKK
jgi:dTDP-glucose 4,6-dehydratase